jgi:hypothetical protein
MGDACRLVWGLERGRMIHDALVLAMDKSKTTEPDKPKKRKPVKKVEPGEPEMATALETFHLTFPKPKDWRFEGCECPVCREYEMKLRDIGVNPADVMPWEKPDA